MGGIWHGQGRGYKSGAEDGRAIGVLFAYMHMGGILSSSFLFWLSLQGELFSLLVFGDVCILGKLESEEWKGG